VEHSAVDAVAVAQAQRAGIGLGAWTVNDPAEMKRLIGAGVTILITDQPDVAKTLLKR
jgi:glycerophosphoryl diester phosphodiesterase